MQVTDRPSPDAPSLTQGIIVQMVYSCTCTCTTLDKKKEPLPRFDLSEKNTVPSCDIVLNHA